MTIEVPVLRLELAGYTDTQIRTATVSTWVPGPGAGSAPGSVRRFRYVGRRNQRYFVVFTESRDATIFRGLGRDRSGSDVERNRIATQIDQLKGYSKRKAERTNAVYGRASHP